MYRLMDEAEEAGGCAPPVVFTGDYDGRGVHRLANVCGDVQIGYGSRIDAFVTITGKVKIGRFCHISTGACIFGGAGFTMGDHSGLSPGAKVFTATENVDMGLMHPTAKHLRFPIEAPIRVGGHCAVGANSVLLPGADLEDGVVLGYNSGTRERLESWTVWAGNPARFIRMRKQLEA
jgi:acetyltransferase-like isoleucine patch superfamily enzyme